MSNRAASLLVPSLLVPSLLVLLVGCGPGQAEYDFDGDGVDDSEDCAPADARVHAGAADEYGDGVDSDCDGFDGVDADGDGFPVDPGDTGVLADCNDADDQVYPGAPDEPGDGIDSDCDGNDTNDQDADGTPATIDCDDLDPALNETDADGDGHSTCDGDCDDADADVSPAAAERCNGVDDDCNGLADLDGEWQDADADGALACDDCDDGDPASYPGADEVCDGLDTDCSGLPDAPGEEQDGDGDGAPLCVDCDDDEASVRPGAEEVCNGVDDDCEGGADFPGELLDADGDGALACADCNDGNAGFIVCVPPWGIGVPSSAADVILDGDGWTARAGSALRVPGDLTGDGLADVLVGSIGSASQGTLGKLHLLSGATLASDLLDVVAVTTLTGEQGGDLFGSTVSARADLDGDTLPDLVVTSTDYGGTGAFYVVSGAAVGGGLGSAPVSSVLLARWTCPSGGGAGIGVAGDYDGDGEVDLLLTCTTADQVANYAGKVFVVLGDGSGTWAGGALDVVADWSLLGEPPRRRLGHQVLVDDFDGDGADDVVLGTGSAPAGDGAVYYLEGGVSWGWDVPAGDAASTTWVLPDGESSLGPVGDLDGDGLPDLAFADALASNYGPQSGTLYLLLSPPSGWGGGDPSADAVAVLHGEPGSKLGQAAARGGLAISRTDDLSGDGVPDLVLGAYGFGGVGAVFVVPAPTGGLPPAEAWVGVEAASSFWGVEPSAGLASAATGDIDGDGNGDLVLAAPYEDVAASNEGRIHVFFGP